MKEKNPQSLLRKSLTHFILYTAIILLLATPLFYLLTRNFYAEDMLDIIEEVRRGHPIPQLDLEEDIMKGVMLQFGLISAVLGIAFVVVMRSVSGKLWKPFDRTLKQIEDFRLESGKPPRFDTTGIKEFNRLNNALQQLVENNLESYKIQKEFTENASHELQTPLAIMQSKLEVLIQLPTLTQEQADVIQDMLSTLKRMTQLNRSLLLLARIDNRQYEATETIDLVEEIKELVPSLRVLTNGISIGIRFDKESYPLRCNRILLDSMMNNLVVNAVRHNRVGGQVSITLTGNTLDVSNTSDEPELDAHHIFNRFYRPSPKTKGNGLGLAIVKAICNYHGWAIQYRYAHGVHHFIVDFLPHDA